MNEYVSAVTHLIGEVVEFTSRDDALIALFVALFVPPFYLFIEQPPLSLVTVVIMVLLWLYAACGLCFFYFVLERLVIDDE